MVDYLVATQILYIIIVKKPNATKTWTLTPIVYTLLYTGLSSHVKRKFTNHKLFPYFNITNNFKIKVTNCQIEKLLTDELSSLKLFNTAHTI